MNQLTTILFAALFVSLACPVKAELSTEELPGDLRFAIEENTKLVTDSLSEVAGFTLGMDDKSIRWLDGFIQRNRNEDYGDLVDVLGSYIGDAIIARHGGKWVIYEGEPAVAIQDDFVVFPFSHVAKQFENGKEDSIAYLYRAIGQILEDHRNR